MMTNFRPFLSVAALLLAGVGTTFAATAKLEGKGYEDARRIIIGYGWKPLLGDCGGGGAGKEVCYRYPEVGYCALTGYGYCTMVFYRKSQCLLVLTTGGPPRGRRAEPTVSNVTIGTKPCSKNNGLLSEEV